MGTRRLLSSRLLSSLLNSRPLSGFARPTRQPRGWGRTAGYAATMGLLAWSYVRWFDLDTVHAFKAKKEKSHDKNRKLTMEEQARDRYIRMRHDLLGILRDHGRTYAEEGQALIEQARNDANEQLNMVKNFYEHRLGKLNERMEQALLDLEAKYNADTVHSNCQNPIIGQVSDCPQNEHVSPQTNTIGTLPNLNNYINFQQERSSRNDGEKRQMIQPPVKSIIRPKFQKGDNKLTSDIEYTLWRHRIRHELLSQDCLFLIDKDIQPTQIYDDKMIYLMKSSVISYLLSNLEERHQRHVRHAHDPAEMMSELDKVCDLTSSFSEHQYRTMFNNIKYDPRQQSVMDFLNEFDDLIEKIRKCPDSQLSDSQIKHNLLTAFAEALPNVVSSLKQEPRPGKSIQEIKDALQSEEHMLKELHRRSSSGKALYGKTRYSYPKRPYSTLHNEKSDQYQRSTHKSFRRPPTCKNCGIQGHMADQCRKSGRVCYNCGRDDGHISADCPLALTESSKQHRQVQNQKTPAQVRIEHTKAKQFRNKKKSWPKRRQMPFKAAIAESKRRAKEGKSFLAIIADPQNNDPEQMCWVEEVDSDDETDHAMYTHHRNNDHDESPSGAAFSNIERRLN